MKTSQIFIRCFVVFLLGRTATATYSSRRRPITTNVAVMNNILPHRGGGGGDSLTKQQQNTTTTTSWFSKLQLNRSNRNHSNNDTATKTTTSTRIADDVTDTTNHDTINGSSPIVLINNVESNRTGWFQQRQPWRNKSNSSAIATIPSKNNTTISTKRKGWGRRNPTKEYNDSINNVTTTTGSTPMTSSSTANSTSSTRTNTETIVMSSDGSCCNNTNTSSTEQQPPQPPPPQQTLPLNANNGVIVIGPGLAQLPHHHQQQQHQQQQHQQQQQYYRGQPVIIRGTPTTSNPTGMTGGMTPNPTNSLAIVLIELFSSVIGKAMYFWFLTWLMKRLAQQEEGMIMPTQQYVCERLNDRHSRDAVALQTVIREPPLGVSYKRWYRQHIRQVQQQSNRCRSSKSTTLAPKLADTFTRTVVVVELSESDGNSKSSATINFKAMSDVVSFLLQQQRQHAFGTSKVTGHAMPLEIVFIINSPGGEVSKYGLAAAQMRRLKNQLNITTTVCVDKYAASGGFMIASQADKLVAAPFAMIGSVGVIMEGLNFYELAKRYGVQPLVLKAGESKNPLSLWGPVTRQDLAQEQKQIEKVHDAFKEYVTEGRPGVIDYAQQVMDGSVYLGLEAKGFGLIDDIMTTDEYIFNRIEAGDRVLRLHRSQQGRFDRTLRFSPLDVLPHLQSWLSSALKHFV